MLGYKLNAKQIKRGRVKTETSLRTLNQKRSERVTGNYHKLFGTAALLRNTQKVILVARRHCQNKLIKVTSFILFTAFNCFKKL